MSLKSERSARPSLEDKAHGCGQRHPARATWSLGASCSHSLTQWKCKEHCGVPAPSGSQMWGSEDTLLPWSLGSRQYTSD